MLQVKIKLGLFSAVSAIVLGLFAYPFLVPAVNTPTQISSHVLKLDTPVDEDSGKVILNFVQQAKSYKSLLILESPGGDSVVTKNVIRAGTYTSQLDTYIPNLSFSAAADMWTMGRHRFIEPDATVMFHASRLMPNFTSHELQLILDFMRSPQLEAAPAEGFKNLSKADKGLLEELQMLQAMTIGLSDRALEEIMEVEIDLLHRMDLSQLHAFDKIVAESNGKLTLQMIQEKLFKNFERDSIVTGQELYDMGIANCLGAPNLNSY